MEWYTDLVNSCKDNKELLIKVFEKNGYEVLSVIEGKTANRVTVKCIVKKEGKEIAFYSIYHKSNESIDECKSKMFLIWADEISIKGI